MLPTAGGGGDGGGNGDIGATARVSLRVAAQRGGFEGMLATRHVEWRLHNVLAPVGSATLSSGGGVGGVGGGGRGGGGSGGGGGDGGCAADAAPSVETWWEAATLTTHVLVRDVDVQRGATVEATLMRGGDGGGEGGGSGGGSTSVDLCSPFVGVSRRVAAVRERVDDERKATKASQALNRLEETAVRMANDPAGAAAELAAYPARLAAAVRLHTHATVGAPTPELQTLMGAWLGRAD